MFSPTRMTVGTPIHGRCAPYDSLPFAFEGGTGHANGGDAEFKLCHRSLPRTRLDVLNHLDGSIDHDGIPTFGGGYNCIACVRNR
jgi:hypothetical protein